MPYIHHSPVLPYRLIQAEPSRPPLIADIASRSPSNRHSAASRICIFGQPQKEDRLYAARRYISRTKEICREPVVVSRPEAGRYWLSNREADCISLDVPRKDGGYTSEFPRRYSKGKELLYPGWNIHLDYAHTKPGLSHEERARLKGRFCNGHPVVVPQRDLEKYEVEGRRPHHGIRAVTARPRQDFAGPHLKRVVYY